MLTFKSLYKHIFKKPMSDFKLERKFTENRQEALIKTHDKRKSLIGMVSQTSGFQSIYEAHDSADEDLHYNAQF